MGNAAKSRPGFQIIPVATKRGKVEPMRQEALVMASASAVTLTQVLWFPQGPHRDKAGLLSVKHRSAFLPHREALFCQLAAALDCPVSAIQ
jgi:hypothetical protein